MTKSAVRFDSLFGIIFRRKIDENLYEFEDIPVLDKNVRHNISVVVDRLVVKSGIESRLVDSLRTALDLAEGIAVVEVLSKTKNHRIVFFENFACPVSGFTIAEIEPRLFSFNAPSGACRKCDGLGLESFFDESLIIPDVNLTLSQGALSPWARKNSPYIKQTLMSLASAYDFSLNTPWKDLRAEVRALFLNGSNGKKTVFKYAENGRVYEVERPFEGIIPNLERRYVETGSSWIREEFERYRSDRECASCQGHRLNREALAVQI